MSGHLPDEAAHQLAQAAMVTADQAGPRREEQAGGVADAIGSSLDVVGTVGDVIGAMVDILSIFES